MTNSQRLAMIRNALTAWIRQQPDAPGSVRRPDESTTSGDPSATGPGGGVIRFAESMVIREGFFCGRRLAYADWVAVWFMEEDQVKITSADTAMRLETWTPEDIDHWAASFEATTEPAMELKLLAMSTADSAEPDAAATGQAQTPDQSDQSVQDDHSERRAA
ncbi:hypothetical protein [Crateriforma conspicua]|uniref:hypothetical protein n=1 Tax=Crateriforma conspicua TaxID=2527996 RepID=UPI00118B912C|nr:hypothetical protein [Crateriforma conspicua]QDV64031.1 hypothetical protein Mal65_31790 [Crateriforma conspicua]